MSACLSYQQISSILDLGSGTGRFSAALAQKFACQVIALDPSGAMLKQNHSLQQGDVLWKQGCAEKIPLNSDTVDLVWMSQVFHHFDNRKNAIDEIIRVLAPNGILAIRNGTRETDEETYWVQCFPEALEMDINRLPSRSEIGSVISRSGFEVVLMKTIYQLTASSGQEYYKKISRRGLSPLIAISDVAFQCGLDRLKDWVDSQFANRPVYEPVDLFVFKVLI